MHSMICNLCGKAYLGNGDSPCPDCWGNVWIATNRQNQDIINHPPHYTQHKSGVECIQITEHMSFCLGNVMKYVWRADEKGGLEDLKKARWYLEREISRRELSGE